MKKLLRAGLMFGSMLTVLAGAGPAFADDCMDTCDEIPKACVKGCDQTAKGNTSMCKAKCEDAAKACRKRCEKKSKN